MIEFLSVLCDNLLVAVAHAYRHVRTADRINRLEKTSEIDWPSGVYRWEHLEDKGIAFVETVLRNGQSAESVFVDVDDFSDVNLHIAHDAGDAVIRHLGAALRENFRGQTAHLAFSKGDQFFVLTSGRGHVHHLMERVAIAWNQKIDDDPTFTMYRKNSGWVLPRLNFSYGHQLIDEANNRNGDAAATLKWAKFEADLRLGMNKDRKKGRNIVRARPMPLLDPTLVQSKDLN